MLLLGRQLRFLVLVACQYDMMDYNTSTTKRAIFFQNLFSISRKKGEIFPVLSVTCLNTGFVRHAADGEDDILSLNLTENQPLILPVRSN
jgi:hypothetical protein